MDYLLISEKGKKEVRVGPCAFFVLSDGLDFFVGKGNDSDKVVAAPDGQLFSHRSNFAIFSTELELPYEVSPYLFGVLHTENLGRAIRQATKKRVFYCDECQTITDNVVSGLCSCGAQVRSLE